MLVGGNQVLKRKYHFIIIQNNEMGYINYKVTFSFGLGGHQHFLKIQNFFQQGTAEISPGIGRIQSFLPLSLTPTIASSVDKSICLFLNKIGCR